MRELEIVQSEKNLPTLNDLEVPFLQAIQSVDDIVLKKYLLDLSTYEIVPVKESQLKIDRTQNIRIFKINEMVYETDGFSTDKFATLFSTFSNKDHSIFLLIDSDGIDVDLYFGINTNGAPISANTIKNAFENTLKGQFPGIKTSNIDLNQSEDIFKKITDYQHVSSYSGVAFDRDETTKENKDFIQGLERFLMAMEGKKFTGIVLSTPVKATDIESTRKQLESIYTNLSSHKSNQISYTINQNKNVGYTENTGTTSSTNTSQSASTSLSESKSKSQGDSKTTLGGKVLQSGAAIASGYGAYSTLAAVATGAVVAPAVPIIAAVAGVAAIMANHQVSDTKSTSTSQSISESETKGSSLSDNYSLGKTAGYSTGDTQGVTLTKENKMISNLLEKLDEQLKRQQAFDNTGAFGCATYFLSDSPYEAEFAASSYRALVSGEKTATETKAINLWDNKNVATKEVKNYLGQLAHPIFKYNKIDNLISEPIEVSPTTIVSGRELALHMGLPRKSVGNFPVVEHALFGSSVLKYNTSNDEYNENIPLGNIYHLGESKPQQVHLDKESLSMHTFITGATGSGKSNTTYLILEKLVARGVNFLVIEPAKGEYKHLFGNREDVSVYGTNSYYSDLLRINPFYFPKGTHVLEHIDRLIEIFNVCWPMYAAMPAILKEATLNAYESVGWDLTTSDFFNGALIYPNFFDLENELESVINSSSYSADTKGDYIGALVTRVHSLTTGLNQFIFSNNDLSDKELFDENVIIDLSRVGSMETKSLIMGLLVMRLNEYRVCQAQELGEMNQSLKHITVLEEAHNLLKRTSQEQSSEGSNLVGKSVEMLTNSIAEMRTYGEGFIIVDQSPTAVDLSAIKNTNTKIIMRTPEFTDREVVGKSIGLNDEQIKEIIKIPKGVGVIYQNDWIEAVLCSVSKAKSEELIYQYEPKILMSERQANEVMLKFLISYKANEKLDLSLIKKSLSSFKTTALLNRTLIDLVAEYEQIGKLKIWNINHYGELATYIYKLAKISTNELKTIVIKYENTQECFTSINRLVEKKYKQLDTVYQKEISRALIREKAEENSTFHGLYQILSEEKEELL